MERHAARAGGHAPQPDRVGLAPERADDARDRVGDVDDPETLTLATALGNGAWSSPSVAFGLPPGWILTPFGGKTGIYFIIITAVSCVKPTHA